MIVNLGKVMPGSMVYIPWNSFAGADGSQITATNYATADLLVYKDGGTTERGSTAGFTATVDFDSKTGKQLAAIDLADNTTAGFFAAGSKYMVAIDAVTIDGAATGGWVACFEIGYPGATLDTTIATLTDQVTFTLTDGPAEDDALNDRWAMIHDVASKVQATMVRIADYVGSTKQVTLAAAGKFTVAAGDNVSVMGPILVQADLAKINNVGANAVSLGAGSNMVKTCVVDNTAFTATDTVFEVSPISGITHPGNIIGRSFYFSGGDLSGTRRIVFNAVVSGSFWRITLNQACRTTIANGDSGVLG